ncbi:sigma-54-dependent transcriptional regulator [Zhouia amylolytica]|uniref:sigma-54-dependent transcriptional regulator n=1 Tax=Zhouia amylolytica TaxID=376730 RepID=UPI0020CF055C|nr:sigma-54 dependent transcriptional regulator [Zhouia amylolytica]MCQ0112081.1 sigma-54-dependent Fis family transcriptional regulator [Zhouia amylolytica]
MKSNTKHPYKILVLDDDETVCQSLRYLFIKQGWEVQTLTNPLNAVAFLKNNPADLILLDLNFRVGTDGKEGLGILKEIKSHTKEVPVILFTAWGSMQLAIDGMKLGAADFLTKPWDNENLIAAIRTQLQLRGKNEDRPTSHSSLDAIIGTSETIKAIKEWIVKAAPTDATVLISGESGTGKELVAKAIHDLSKRQDQAFVSVNLGAIPDSLFESELFGHKKGAFTSAVSDREGRFKLAEKGTLFLDEIGDLALASQVKLLRVLQEKTFEPLGGSKPIKTDVRIISATHKDLSDMVVRETFREDLFYRINLLHIHLPALSERREDIPLLVNHFIQQFNATQNKKVKVESHALEWLEKQAYPGNIRQLKNCIERTVLLTAKNSLGIKDFKPHLEAKPGGSNKFPKVGELTLDEMEKTLIANALEFYAGNITDAARSLGITRSALYRRIEKYNINYDA